MSLKELLDNFREELIKKAKEYAIKDTNLDTISPFRIEYKEFKDEYVSIEHLLLGVLASNDSVSALMKDIGISNLNAAQQTTIANAATIATMDMANLNNRQQAAVQNAKAFLETDLKNLDNKQQLAVVQSQQIAQSILSDASAKNAASLTNATNAIEVDKINATLALTAQQFSASEKNKVALANMDASNELIKFNAQEANDRADFNAKMSTEINVANARLLAEVSTANTASVNAANAVNAKNATDLTSSAYAQQSQTYRDLLSYSYKAGEGEKDRITQVAVASINKSALTSAAEIKTDGDTAASWGKLAYEVIKGW